jgi:5-methylthioadenosine/S-adenosylhomocysteine deaminase
MADMIVVNGFFVTMQRPGEIFRDYAMAITDGRIVAIGPKKQILSDHRASVEIDASDCLVCPGLVNAHTHLSERLLAGLVDDLPLMEWLEKLVWPAGLMLDSEDVYISSLLACVEMAKGGVTLFNDMFVHHGKGKILGRVADAVKTSGLSAVLARGARDDLGEEFAELVIDETRDAHRVYGGFDDRIFFRMAPTLVFVNSKEYLMRLWKESERMGTGIHTHIQETSQEVERMKAKYGVTTVEFLDKLQLLTPKLVAAHCVWLNDADIEMLAKGHACVVYNPTSNAKLGNGVAPIPELMRRGIVVALGTDGSASSDNQDLISAMRFGGLLQKAYLKDPKVLPSWQLLELATTNGAKALGMEKSCGTLEQGKWADFILVDLKSTNLTPAIDPVKQFALSAHGGNVRMTVVHGRIIAEGGHMLTVDEESLYKEAMRRSERIASKLGFGA